MEQPVLAPAPAPAPSERRPFVQTVRGWLRDYFLNEDPTFGVAAVPLCFMSMLLFTRHPLKTNFIFDEQEALLANPYVRSIADPNSKLHWLDAFRRDFWGLPPERSIGSYRPIPDLVWRALWGIGARDQTPFLHHWVNVLLHGVNGAILTMIVLRMTKDRRMAWLAGACFVGCAVLTEAVSGVVGIADVLGALGVLLALAALGLRGWKMPFAVFFATLFGLYSKESALCAVPLVPFAALMTSRLTHGDKGKARSWLRMLLALIATAAAFVFYVEARRRMFPAPLAAELSVENNVGKSDAHRAFSAVLRWYAQPSLPRDPLNNPLAEASGPLRLAGGLRVYARGLFQIICPMTLSGDYSAPQEPIPDRVIFPESVIGGLAMVVPLILAPVFGILAWLRAKKTPATERVEQTAGPYRDGNVTIPVEKRDLRPLAGAAMVFVVVSYFPVSNIPILLPTVRAERFWYFPAIGTSILLAMLFAWMFRVARAKDVMAPAIAVLVVFLGFQGMSARRHANDYTDDLVFWDATRRAVPRSAKAHLNYSVMQGARGNLEERLRSSRTALELAPKWPMASVYLGDTLCRLHRAEEAWPYYQRGYELAPNDQNLVALGMQCLWDEKAMGPDSKPRVGLEELAEKHPGSWVAFLTRDTIDNGEAHNGVDPKYRPRGYNEGPKGE
ncbi:MAG: repeat protein [Myxococcaceae bacterium]|nr:repeat protein [Myxococcaceae bacterium]